MTALLPASLIAVAAIVTAGSAGAAFPQDSGTAGASTLRVDWAEFKKLYDAKKIAVVDVRGSDGFKTGHIPGAQSVPLDQIEKRAAELKKLQKPIVTYCACTAEDTSVRAAQALRKHGVEARALIGGYHRWLREEGRAER